MMALQFTIIHGESNTVDRAFGELRFNVCYSKYNYIVLGEFESPFGFFQVVLRFSLLSIMIWVFSLGLK